MKFLSVCFLTLLGSMVAPGQAEENEFSSSQKKQIEDIVYAYLMKNPQVLQEALDIVQAHNEKEQTNKRIRLIRDREDVLVNSAFQGTFGNPKGTVSLVQFSDYNCGYCKRFTDDLEALLKKYPDLKFVLKDFPILGSASVEAARVASAVRKQLKGNDFLAYHLKLLKYRGRVDESVALDVAREMKIDMKKLEEDMKDSGLGKGLAEIADLAEALNIQGTPSYVLGGEVIPGGLPLSILSTKIDNVRNCGQTQCPSN